MHAHDLSKLRCRGLRGEGEGMKEGGLDWVLNGGKPSPQGADYTAAALHKHSASSRACSAN